MEFNLNQNQFPEIATVLNLRNLPSRRQRPPIQFGDFIAPLIIDGESDDEFERLQDEIKVIDDEEMKRTIFQERPKKIDDCGICYNTNVNGKMMKCCNEKNGICHGCIKEITSRKLTTIVNCPYCRKQTNFYEMSTVINK